MDQDSTNFPVFNPPASLIGRDEGPRRLDGLGEQDGSLRTPNTLAPPAVSSLRLDSAGVMQRSLSEDIREEREELREAAEQTLNVILDLNLDGTIRWVSPSWADVIGTPPDTIPGRSVSDLIISDNKTIFTDIVDCMKKDDSRSRFIRFAMKLGPLSVLAPLQAVTDPDHQGPVNEPTVDLEAQGIMVFDTASGGESHVSSFARDRVRVPCWDPGRMTVLTAASQFDNR